MRMIRPDDIPLEIAIPGDLFSGDGSILLKKGQILDDELRKRLNKRVHYVKSDWPTLTSIDQYDHSPDEVIEALAEQRGEKLVLENRRKNARHRWKMELELEIQEAGPMSLPRRIHVTTKDISMGGFAFIHTRPIAVGTRLCASFNMLPHRPTLHGKVLHCTPINGTQYRVGAQFEAGS